ncbi:hypothetical protein FOL47_010388 [Perkinsus chesapeaki]|uniref:MSP domain-containing protein n=1 Tax=Perkinsus chesapeaki TaxID=330153 RepID=A0A7J6N2B5_PERCH|nr:hypothetical protein FOL47_010388 [Perkinsus chesapeaki]
MPSLLSVKPGEIVFPNTLYQSVNTTLSLTNVDAEKKAVAFKIKTTAPRNYLVRPSSGVVAPDATVDVQIILQPQTSDPSLNTDRFLIQATTSATGQPLERDEWARVAKSEIHEQRLHVIFKPAEDGAAAAGQSKQGGKEGSSTSAAAPTAAPTSSANIAAGELRSKYDELVQYTLSIEKEKAKLEKELEASKEVYGGYDDSSSDVVNRLELDGESADRGGRRVAHTAEGREADPQLSEQGWKQAEATAEYLADMSNKGVWRIRKVIVSPMLRTLHTARPILEKLSPAVDGKVAIDCRFHEEGGLFQGARRRRGADEEFVFGLNRREAFDELHYGKSIDCVDWIGTKKDESEGWWTGGYEEASATRVRAKAVAEALWETAASIDKEHPEEENSAVVVVSHGLFLDSVYCELLGIPNDDSRSTFFMTANCSLSIMMFSVEGNKRKAGFVCHDSIAHLPSELRSGHSIGGMSLPQSWVEQS